MSGQERLKELERKDERMEKKMGELEEEKRSLKDPLSRLTVESKDLHRKLMSYNKDKATLTVRNLPTLSESLYNKKYSKEL